MKSMKSLLVAALVVGSLFACNTEVLAQAGGAGAPGAGAGAPGGGGRRGGAMTSDAMLTRLQTALGETNKLSDAQLPKVKAVFDDQIKKMTDLRNDTTTAPADRVTKRTAIQKETTDALKAILTPAQFKIYQSLPLGGRRAGGGGGGAPPAPAPAN
jgi:Spy/CpxP family protein refolding chaperone